MPTPESQLQGDLGLNIREAHVFNTTDGFALDVFVVDGWNGDVSNSDDELQDCKCTLPVAEQIAAQ